MLRKIFRLSAVLALPFMATAVAQADYGQHDPAYDGQEGPPALILYSGENFTGEVREIYDPIYALPDLAFNDRARSVAVLGGQWEVCEHSDFTGRCLFLRYDVPDLGWFGMERNVSSVRPVLEYTEAEHGLMFVRDRNGYIRYVDNERYGYDNYSYGYGVSTGIQVYHYGYSPDYLRYGYYDPRLGYDPYGFGWHGFGGYRHYDGYYRRDLPPLRGHYGARDGAVTLYTDSYGHGASFGLNREIRDLSRYRFNDNISSIEIRSGKWEVCTDANFRGQCRIIDASVDKLNGLRLNDNISSIRPIGGSGSDRWDRRDGDRRDGRPDRRDDDRLRGDAPRDARARTSLPPALANAQSAAPAAVPATPPPPATTPPVARRTGERVLDRQREPVLAGAAPPSPVVRARPAPQAPDISDRPARPSTPPALTPRLPVVTEQPAIRPAPTPRASSPPAMRRFETPPAPRVQTPEPARRTMPATPPARVSPPPQPRVQAPQSAPRAFSPPTRERTYTPPPQPQRAAPPAPAPRAAPQRDTRPPALRSRERPTRTQD